MFVNFTFLEKTLVNLFGIDPTHARKFARSFAASACQNLCKRVEPILPFLGS